MSNIPLSKAKAHLSEVIREIQDAGEPVIITVDGKPAAELRPVYEKAPTKLNARQKQAVHFTLDKVIESIGRIEDEEFDAVELIREVRR